MTRNTRILGLVAIFAMLFGVAVSAAPSASAQEAGVNVNFPMGATFQDLTEANAQISSLAETDCSLGSPRFAFGLDADGDGAGDGYVFGYIGDAPSFTACDAYSNGNIVTAGDARWESAQLGGGMMQTFDQVVADFGTLPVVEVLYVSHQGTVSNPYVAFDYVAPVEASAVTIYLSSADPSVASQMSEDAYWTVSQNGEVLFSETFLPEDRDLSTEQVIPVNNPVQYGTYDVYIYGGPAFEEFSAQVTLGMPKEDVQFILQPAAVEPVETDGTVIVSKFYCDNIDDVIFQAGSTAEVSAAAIPTSEPACEPGYGLFTFYLVGDGTNQYAQLEVDGSGSIGLPAGEYEVVEEGTLASTFIEVIAGENTTLVVQNPIADVDPSPEPTEEPGVTPPADPGTDDGATAGGHNHGQKDEGQKAESTPATTTTVTTLPSTGAGAAAAGQSSSLLLAALAGVLLTGAAAISIRSKRA